MGEPERKPDLWSIHSEKAVLVADIAKSLNMVILDLSWESYLKIRPIRDALEASAIALETHSDASGG